MYSCAYQGMSGWQTACRDPELHGRIKEEQTMLLITIAVGGVLAAMLSKMFIDLDDPACAV